MRCGEKRRIHKPVMNEPEDRSSHAAEIDAAISKSQRQWRLYLG